LKNHDRLTAVAQHVSPLLQLVGLQNAQGDLVDATYATVPMELLEQIASEVASGLAHIACWFGGPQHLALHVYKSASMLETLEASLRQLLQ
jgi:hypothetical protein